MLPVSERGGYRRSRQSPPLRRVLVQSVRLWRRHSLLLKLLGLVVLALLLLTLLGGQEADDETIVPLRVDSGASERREIPRVLFAIFTLPQSTARRSLIRETWFKAPGRGINWDARFVVGESAEPGYNALIEAEAATFGDIHILRGFQEDAFASGWSRLADKSRRLLVAAHTNTLLEENSNFRADFVLKTDDDAFFDVPLLLAALHDTTKASGKTLADWLYFGIFYQHTNPMREGRHALTYTQWPESNGELPPYAIG
ncbi:MAG: hypothetical protein MHM6MM_005362 [Cercozoa sp. M6MM]